MRTTGCLRGRADVHGVESRFWLCLEQSFLQMSTSETILGERVFPRDNASGKEAAGVGFGNTPKSNAKRMNPAKGGGSACDTGHH